MLAVCRKLRRTMPSRFRNHVPVLGVRLRLGHFSIIIGWSTSDEHWAERSGATYYDILIIARRCTRAWKSFRARYPVKVATLTHI